MNDNWTDKRVITGWSLFAGCVLAIIVAATTGGVIASQQETLQKQHETAALVECAKTAKTATECRVLIFGAR